MKKLILLFCIALLSVSCGKLIEKWMGRKGGLTWSVYNKTEQALKFRFPSYSASEDDDYLIYEIGPGTLIQIAGYTVSAEKSNGGFDYYFKKCADLYGEDVSWQILSEDDVVLRTWNYSDLGKPNQRFFEESLWSNTFQPTGVTHLTFHIVSEDIE